MKPGRAESQRAQVFTENLWRVCIGSDGVSCASRVIWPQLRRVVRHTRLRQMRASSGGG